MGVSTKQKTQNIANIKYADKHNPEDATSHEQIENPRPHKEQHSYVLVVPALEFTFWSSISFVKTVNFFFIMPFSPLYRRVASRSAESWFSKRFL